MIKDIITSNEQVKVSDDIYKRLVSSFPEFCEKNGSFDIGALTKSLSGSTSIINEGYELNFLGKSYARLVSQTDTLTIVKPDVENNSKDQNKDSNNVYISGDNIDALQHLAKSYAGAVKCVYIDPPYNTGKDEFVYNDKFGFTAADLESKLGITEDQAKKIHDLRKRGSSSHSAWLMFMMPRLCLAHRLLKKDGVIFISIDENEMPNLRLLCDSIFGEYNFIGQLIIQTATDNNPTQINTEHEYMLCYAKDKDSQKEWSRDSEAAKKIQKQYESLKNKYSSVEEIQEALRKWIKANASELPQVTHYNNVDEKGVYSSSSNSSNTKPGDYTYDILHPVTHKPCPTPDFGWRWPESTFWEYEKAGEVLWGKDETSQPHVKKRLETAKEQLKTIIYEDGRASTKMLEKLFGRKKIFDNPKPVSVLMRIFDFVTEDDSIILDFFSGSASTAHAVMQLNAERNSKRKFILVQLPEQCKPKSEAAKAGYQTIDQIGMDRIRFAAEDIKTQSGITEGDFGFKHFIIQDVENTLNSLESFNSDVMFQDNSILDLYGIDSVLTTWAVKDGHGLSPKIEEVKLADYTAYEIGKHFYFIEAGFNEKAMIALIDKYNGDASFNPDKIVLFGYSFTFSQIEMIKKNVATLRDGIKNLKVNTEIRY